MKGLKISWLAAATLLICAVAPAYASGNSKVDFDKLRQENRDKEAISSSQDSSKVDFDKLRQENRDKHAISQPRL